jgi:hypothetical protein
MILIGLLFVFTYMTIQILFTPIGKEIYFELLENEELLVVYCVDYERFINK